MTLDPRIRTVTDRIIERSLPTRSAYLERLDHAASQGPARAHLSCSNAAHAFAAMGDAEKDDDDQKQLDEPDAEFSEAHSEEKQADRNQTS